MRVAYVTAGTVGFGDTVKGLSIRRALARRKSPVDFRVFAPPSDFPATRHQGVAVVDVDAGALTDPARAPSTQLFQKVSAFAPDLVVAGQFWAPLHHLIPLWRAPVWLLLRQAPPQWTQGFAGMPFDPKRYARIAAIEPIELAHVRELIDPLVLANPDDPPDLDRAPDRAPVGRAVDPAAADSAAQTLSLLSGPERSLGVVAVHAGMPGELDELVAKSPKPVTTRFDLRDENAPFPACTVLKDATRVEHIVCGAGYNSYWEARWLGYAARTTFVPFPRRIDDQAWRVSTCGDFIPRENGADVLARAIDEG